MNVVKSKKLLEISNAYIKDGVLIKHRYGNVPNSNYNIDTLLTEGDLVVEENGVIDFFNISEEKLKYALN